MTAVAARLLALFRVPERPRPVIGTEPATMFRASSKYWWYQLLGWAGRQLGALVGILVSLIVLGAFGSVDQLADFLPVRVLDQVFGRLLEGFLARFGVEIDSLDAAGTAIRVGEIVTFVVFPLQLVVSGLLLRLGWLTRWYLVSERAVRIREGVLTLREQTLTLSKVQHMKVQQGPLQRAFGIADLEVRTAGGGAGLDADELGKSAASAHVGHFRGLEDVAALRERLRHAIAHPGGLEPKTGAGSSPAPTRAGSSMPGPGGGDLSAAPSPAPAAAVRRALSRVLAESAELRSAVESWRQPEG